MFTTYIRSMRPASHPGVDDFDWTTIFPIAERSQVTRRAVIKAPVFGVAAFNASLVFAAGDNQNVLLRERLFMEQESPNAHLRILLVVETVKVAETGNNAKSDAYGDVNDAPVEVVGVREDLSHEWIIEPSVFGPEARIVVRLRPQRAEIKRPAVLVEVVDVRHGRRSKASLTLRFYRHQRLVEKGSLGPQYLEPSWHLQAATNFITDGGYCRFGYPDLAKEGERILLQDFMNAKVKKKLQSQIDAATLHRGLGLIFNDLVQVRKGKQSGYFGLSFDRDFIWQVTRNSDDSGLEIGLPGNAVAHMRPGLPTGMVMARVRDGNRLSFIGIPKEQPKKAAELSTVLRHDSTHVFDLHEPGASRETWVRVFDIRSEVESKGEPPVSRAEVAVSGQWSISARRANGLDTVFSGIKKLPGILRRRVDAYVTHNLRERILRPSSNGKPQTYAGRSGRSVVYFPVEETVFAGGGIQMDEAEPGGQSARRYADAKERISGSLANNGEFDLLTPIGMMSCAPVQAEVSDTPVVAKPDGPSESDDKVVKSNVEDFSDAELPFRDQAGSPVLIVSRGSEYDPSGDRSRQVDWFEANMQIRASALALEGADYSRLRFSDAPVTFLFNPDPVGGYPDSYVWLGPTPVGKAGAPAHRARLSMSRATLDVSRSFDLAQLRFGFAGLYLLVSDRLELVPAGSRCGVIANINNVRTSRLALLANAAGGRSNAASGNEKSGDTASSGDRLPVASIEDTRPVLTVELPPQHILEQAFFQRSLGPLPDIDYTILGTELRSDPEAIKHFTVQLRSWRGDAALNVDVREREQILKALSNIDSADQRRIVRDAICRKKAEKIDAKVGFKLPDGPRDRLNAQIEAFKYFAEQFRAKVGSVFGVFPRDQLSYIGDFAMDPDVVAFARTVQKDADRNQSTKVIINVFDTVLRQRDDLLNRDSDGSVSSQEALKAYGEAKALGRAVPGRGKLDFVALERYLESTSPTYGIFRSLFRDVVSRPDGPGTGSMDAHGRSPNEQEFILPLGRGLLAWIEEATNVPSNERGFKDPEVVLPWGDIEDSKRFEADFRDTLIEFVEKAGGTEKLVGPADAYVSRASRLAFRINCRDGLTDQRDASNHRRIVDGNVMGRDGYVSSSAFTNGVDSIPFTFADLTNWSAMELSVPPRAQVVFAPPISGRLDQNSARSINLHGAAMLDHLGFATGADPETRTWHRRAELIAGSLRSPPGRLETAIDLPSRLTLSPSQRAVFLSPSYVNTGIFNVLEGAEGNLVKPAGDLLPVEMDAFGTPSTIVLPPKPLVEYDHLGDISINAILWSADLLTGDVAAPAGVRAVYSPDLNPDVLLKIFAPLKDDLNQTGYGAPPRGPWAPWFLGRNETGRTSISPKEYWDLVHEQDTARFPSDGTYVPPGSDEEACFEAGSSDQAGDRQHRNLIPSFIDELCRVLGKRKPQNHEIIKFRTSLDAFDRHEIVMLSSAYGMPVMPGVGRNERAGGVEQSSQFKPDPDYEVVDIYREQEIYRPRELNVTQLSLTAIGGTLVHDTSFSPPASAKYFDGRNLFDAFSVERYQHEISLGRDVYAEVSYAGFLYPIGIPASLVKVTERIFAIDENASGPNGQRHTAFLQQRMFIRIANPEKTYGSIGQPFRGRGFPVRHLRLLTTKTPDIVDPTAVRHVQLQDRQGHLEDPSGRVFFENVPGLVFWPRTRHSISGDIEFELTLDNVFTSGRFLFVDNVAANDPDTLSLLEAYYNDSGEKSSDANGVNNSERKGVESPDIGRNGFLPIEVGGTPLTTIEPDRHRRTFQLGGAKLRFAKERKSGDTLIATDSITLRAEGRAVSETLEYSAPDGETNFGRFALQNTRRVFDPALQAARQPPFYPAMETARVIFEDNARLTGSQPQPVRVAFDGHYLVHGFASDRTLAEADGGVGITRAPETYLNILDSFLQDMGAKGEQSGGVFRPGGQLRLVTRDKGLLPSNINFNKDTWRGGPILPAFSRMVNAAPAPGNNASTMFQIRDGTTKKKSVGGSLEFNKDADAIIPANARELLNHLFGEAKLLGIIKLTDLVRVIEVLSINNVPQMRETYDYAMGSVGDASENVEDFARREVLVPLAALARDAEIRWKALDENLRNRQKNLVGESIGLEELFPEIDDALRVFASVIDKAIDSSSGALLGELSRVYESGRLLLDVLAEAASEAVERFETAIERRVPAVRDAVEALLKGTKDALRAFISDLRGDLKEKLLEALFGTSSDETETVLVKLPVPFTTDLTQLAVELGVTEPGAADRFFDPIRASLSFKVAEARSLISTLIDDLINGQDPLGNPAGFRQALRMQVAAREKAITVALFELYKDQRIRARSEKLLRLQIELQEYIEVLEWLTEPDQIGIILKRNIETILNSLKLKTIAIKESIIQDLNDVVSREFETFKENINTELETYKNEAESAIWARLQIVLEEILPIVDYILQSRALFGAFEQSVNAGKIGPALTAGEALASHVLQRRLTVFSGFLEKVNQSAEIVARHVRRFDAGALTLLDFKVPLNEPCIVPPVLSEFVNISPKSDVLERTFLVESVPNTGKAEIATFVVDLRHRLDEFAEFSSQLAEIKKTAEEQREKLDKAGITEEVFQFRDNVDGLLRSVGVGSAQLYCDLVTDASSVAGLGHRIEAVAAVIEKFANGPTDNLEAVIQETGRDLKRLLATRQVALRRTAGNAETLLTAVRNLVVSKEFPIAALIGTLAEKSGGRETDVREIAARIAMWAARLIQTAARTLRALLISLAQTLEQISDLAATLANKPTDRDERIAIEATLQELGIKQKLDGKTQTLKDLANTIRIFAGKENDGTEANGLAAILSVDLSVDAAVDPDKSLAKAKMFSMLLANNSSSAFSADAMDAASNAVKQAQLDLRACLDFSNLGDRALTALELAGTGILNDLGDTVVKKVLEVSNLPDLYEVVFRARLDLMESRNPVIKTVEKLLLVEFGENDSRRRELNFNGERFVPFSTVSEINQTNDLLAAERAWLKVLAVSDTPFSGSLLTDPNTNFRSFWETFGADWVAGKASPARIIEGLVKQIRDILRGDVDLDDLIDIRAEMEVRLFNLFPVKKKFEYKLDFPLPSAEVAMATSGFFKPGEECAFSLGAATTIDLLPTGLSKSVRDFNPKITSSSVATLGAFDIKMVGNFFDAFTIRFSSARFESDLKSEANFKAVYAGYEIGEKLEFLEPLASFMNPGNGPFVRPLQNSPGIEAGYALPLPYIPIGNVIFSNVFISASVEIPFNNQDARFKAGLSTQQSPFMVAYAPFGGEGFLSVTANAKKIVGFELGLAFGAVVPFEFGPLKGNGRVTTGVYIRKITLDNGLSVTDLSATFYAGGSGRIWRFSFCVSLFVMLTQRGGGSMRGLAIFTYSFKIGFAKFTFQVKFEKEERKGFSGDQSGQQSAESTRGGSLFGPGDRNMFGIPKNASGENYVDAVRIAGLGAAVPVDKKFRIELEATYMDEHWGEYVSQFSADEPAEGLLP